MNFTFNHPRYEDRRKELRNQATDSERFLWSKLCSKQILGLKFQRQYGVGPYIVDFYCPERKLAIEVDGSQHLEPDQKVYDENRTAFLREHGINVVRFWSNDVMRNIDGVIEEIIFILSSPAPS